MSDSARARHKALNIFYGAHPIVPLGAGVYDVPSETVGGKYYTVNLPRNYCECPQNRKRKKVCKHMYAARMWRDAMDGKPIDAEPTSNPYKNPRYYDRLRVARRPSVRQMLRCIGMRVSG